MISNHFDWLNRWHTARRKDSRRGIELDALADGSWRLTVPLEGTAGSANAFAPVSVHRSENDWIECRVEGTDFQASAGPRNLVEALRIFRRWSEEKHSPDKAA